MKKWIPYIFLLLSLFSLLIVSYISTSNPSDESKVDSIRLNVAKEVREASSTLETIEKDIRFNDFVFNSAKYPKQDVFIYERSKLKFWSQNSYEFNSRKILLENRSVFFVNNDFGSFILLKSISLNYTIVLSIPIVRKYKANNMYVSNELNTAIFNSIKGDIIVSSLAEGDPITLNGEELFKVDFS